MQRINAIERINGIMVGVGMFAVLAGSGCDLGKNSLGELDDGVAEETGSGSESESGTDDSGYTVDPNICDAPLEFELEYAIEGLPAQAEIELTLHCAASAYAVADAPFGAVIELTQCTDTDAQPVADLTVLLYGNWQVPTLSDGIVPATTVRYVQQSPAEQLDRWLVLERDDALAMPFAAIGASALHPPGVADFDYGPITLTSKSAGCGPEPGTCGLVDRQMLSVEYAGDRGWVYDASFMDDIGGNAEVHYWVANRHTTVIEQPTCEDVRDTEFVFGLVAHAAP